MLKPANKKSLIKVFKSDAPQFYLIKMHEVPARVRPRFCLKQDYLQSFKTRKT
ncbi:hypothetical protein HMPREF9554_00294 [Treponema phagedenis F0421]|nr:hypothetical protein HMPREF9554_00294 [Treponema phagedenis F0421]